MVTLPMDIVRGFGWDENTDKGQDHGAQYVGDIGSLMLKDNELHIS